MNALKNLLAAVGLLMGMLVAGPALAAIDVYEFDSEQQRARYLAFVEEMRCPKCQNQNLAGSDSPIAADLRREIHRLLQEGKTDAEIVDFMVARYGEFILYEPRVQSTTYLLWVTPLVLLLIGIIVAILLGRRSAGSADADKHHLSRDQQARLDALLKDEQDKS